MKNIIIYLSISIIFSTSINAQGGETGGTREIYTWTINTGTTFRITACSTIWGHSYEITTQYCGATLVDTTITVPDYYSGYILGWDNVVLNCSKTNIDPYFGYSLYKVIIGNNDFIFYFDTRDCDYDDTYPCANDFYFEYDYALNSLIISKDGACTDKTIENGDYYPMWEISEKILPPETDCFENYWQNCLVLIPSPDNNPRLVWGPYPGEIDIIGYRIYRKYGRSQWDILDEVADSIYEYTDTTVTITQPGGPAGTDVYYYVKGLYMGIPSNPSETESSDTVVVNVVGKEIEKISKDLNNTNEYFSGLDQNFPNPFNPTTTIIYELPEAGFVTLKVFDVLGREVAVLVNENKPEGIYSVEFSGENLLSGIYFCTLTIGDFRQTRKMVLMQ